MKLTKEDKELLTKRGYEESDFPQIERAFNKRVTTYQMGGKPISREEAIEALGWERYLSGISRSAFHYTAARETKNGCSILFDSSNLFK